MIPKEKDSYKSLGRDAGAHFEWGLYTRGKILLGIMGAGYIA